MKGEYTIKKRGGAYYLFYEGSQIGYASLKVGGWWWAGQLPGRKSGRKAWDNPADCIASGHGLKKGLVRKLVKEAA